MYLLTGIEPLALADDAERKPHQRQAEAAVLEQHFKRRQLIRVLSVMDVAFNTDLAARYRTAKDLSDALKNAVRENSSNPVNDLESLLAEVDEIALTDEQAALALQRESLSIVLNAIHTKFRAFARERHLDCLWRGHQMPQAGDFAIGDVRMNHDQHGNVPEFIGFRVEPRPPTDYVVFQDGTLVWRGSEPNDALSDAVVRAAAMNFLGR